MMIQTSEMKPAKGVISMEIRIPLALDGAFFMKMFILFLCGIMSLCLFLHFSYAASASASESRGFTLKHCAQVEVEMKGLGKVSILTTRKMLLGPGSHPPRCMTKCGRCSPCKAVHVPVPPGSSVIMEYYPEAWRCKCRDRLYMP